ncbi:hypothetical protein DID78_02335 [Candidatus Marinamargulisbacteria bacterium SCGC AG-343-D04]|nr:hypothetical protein DID78_02335 [Candidatus Marinamargulisbacteria bacterium SCGC AG-343-D04]
MGSLKQSPKKILLQRADKLGDVILSLPTIYAIHKAFPNATIDVVTSEIGQQILLSQPYINHIHCVKWKENQKPSNFFELISSIKQQNYDTYISLWNNPYMALLGFFARIPHRIGDKTNWPLNLLYSTKIKQRWENISYHQIELNLELLKPFNIPSILEHTPVFIEKNAEEKIKKIFEESLNATKKTVLIFTATGGSNYPIPENAVISFIDILQKKHKVNIVVAGQANKKSAFYQYNNESVLNLINSTTLQELTAAIKWSDYYIGPDTGPTHIASFFRKNMIFFSSRKPNPPARWGSLSANQRIIRRDYTCKYFCVKKCHPKECFSYLNADVLMNEFQTLLNNESNTPMDIKMYHLQHTFRILRIYKTEIDRARDSDIICQLNNKGLFIKTIVLPKNPLKRLTTLIHMIIRYNINIIEGQGHKISIACARFYMGAIAVYVKPIVVKQSTTKHSHLDNHIQYYQKACV